MNQNASPTVEEVIDLTAYFPGESGSTLYPGLTMESSKFVLVLRNGKVNIIDTDTKQRKEMGIGRTEEGNISAIVAPTANTVALKIANKDGTEIQVFDCDKQQRIYRVHIHHGTVSFWKWIDDDIIAISVQKANSATITHLNTRSSEQTDIVPIRLDLANFVVWNYKYQHCNNKAWSFVMGLCRCSDGVKGIIQLTQLTDPCKEIKIEAFAATSVPSPCGKQNLIVYAEKHKLHVHTEGTLLDAPIVLSDQQVDFPFLLVVPPQRRESIAVLTKGGILNIFRVQLIEKKLTLQATSVTRICSGDSIVRAVPTLQMGNEISMHVVLSSCKVLRVRCAIGGSAVEDPWATFTGQSPIHQQFGADFEHLNQKPSPAANDGLINQFLEQSHQPQQHPPRQEKQPGILDQLMQDPVPVHPNNKNGVEGHHQIVNNNPPQLQHHQEQPFYVPGPPLPDPRLLAHDLPANTDRYSVTKRLGSGGQGEVFLVNLRVAKGRRQPANSVITCALKRIRCESLTAGNTALEEVKALQALDHPNILKIIDFFLEEVNRSLVVCIACEYCCLGDVHRYVGRIGGFRNGKNWKLLLQWTRQIASALNYLHSNNMIHRDLKPGNLFLSHDQTIKLGDFGLARADDNLAQTQCGTPMFLSPEVIQRKPYGTPVDMWSLGCLLYFLIVPSNQSPLSFQLQTVGAIDGIRAELVAVKTPPELVEIIIGLVQVTPSNRLTAAQVLNMLPLC
eukprot:TRINITY_DN15326_c0_g1_i1.p1 TRINITY_DN15326_c0_g1~~TRINITY_DN15326_c0_g1_i1.p1  ORF type:complete len:732 (+),score=98.68 TRINITY_DN15326_c0_g1_i1:42-2237(+)